MGIFNLLFGGSSKPRVTEKEFKKVRSDMLNQGFNKIQRDRAEAIFKPDLYESPTSTHKRGLEEDEIDARIKWMRENKSKHNFNDHQIDEMEADLKKRL
jgi:hypothetical protein